MFISRTFNSPALNRINRINSNVFRSTLRTYYHCNEIDGYYSSDSDEDDDIDFPYIFRDKAFTEFKNNHKKEDLAAMNELVRSSDAETIYSLKRALALRKKEDISSIHSEKEEEELKKA